MNLKFVYQACKSHGIQENVFRSWNFRFLSQFCFELIKKNSAGSRIMRLRNCIRSHGNVMEFCTQASVSPVCWYLSIKQKIYKRYSIKEVSKFIFQGKVSSAPENHPRQLRPTMRTPITKEHTRNMFCGPSFRQRTMLNQDTVLPEA